MFLWNLFCAVHVTEHFIWSSYISTKTETISKYTTLPTRHSGAHSSYSQEMQSLFYHIASQANTTYLPTYTSVDDMTQTIQNLKILAMMVTHPVFRAVRQMGIKPKSSMVTMMLKSMKRYITWWTIYSNFKLSNHSKLQHGLKSILSWKQSGSWRFTVDYRGSNKVISNEWGWQIPNMRDMLVRIGH